ncbi:MAG: glucose-6-phosphate isomerase [Halioglobus sp.]|nr:glucose-6-phosphate isomerase [Halioglobus sp.]|tara:strand:+ start:1985 stop:3625 length:1641 start_codon:yes stop_codon:yes gene_type:complete
MPAPTHLPDYPASKDLAARAGALRDASIAGLLAADPARASSFTLAAAGLELDYSRHLLDAEALAGLLALADQAGLKARIDALLRGEQLNNTEQRPALHSLLRADRGNGLDTLYAEVAATRERMRALADVLNSGEFRGYSGAPVTDIVNIGIGGSDLGPRLVSAALQPFRGALRAHYVANVDPADICATLRQLDPASTLFIICSKSFRTEETLANALAARQWMLDSGAQATDLEHHFLAVTTNLAAAREFGIPPSNCLPMWDWVGGRYSLWSAVGLSCAIELGWDNFARLLDGARSMDEHFRDSDPGVNMPALMALLEVWYCHFFGAANHVVLPYDHGLRQLPDFLQQLTMESNGKCVTRRGEPVHWDTAPVLWGSSGTLGQHSFHQMLHQGTRLCPVDFVLPLRGHTDLEDQHRRLVANCLAQSRALMLGRSLEEAEASLRGRGITGSRAQELAPHLAMPGNRPSSILSMDALTPQTLGALLALYEHRTFCSAQLWDINAFDQWGVELGKEIGVAVLGRLEGDEGPAMDPATERMLDRIARDKGTP